MNRRSGMNLIENLCQIIFAIAVGFLFVILFYRGGNLLPCILTHSAINSLSTFANEEGMSKETHIVHCLILIAITVAYTLVLVKMLPKENDKN